MELINAVAALSALAHEGRLEIYRLLVAAGPAGLTVGKIAKRVKMPGATLSFHLSQLKHAGLVTAQRNGRELIQTADFGRMNDLVGYLTETCCGGDTAACMPSLVCSPAKKPKTRKAA
ncbi:MAG: helix-turn-helix transcriptional regulator [Rhodospirillaceae bacterium]|nr:helix-turn-helix transcriptional regulator [Rhodospirillaceae bacterium]